MVVTQRDFNKALEEINDSFMALTKRVAELEKQLAEARKAPASKKD